MSACPDFLYIGTSKAGSTWLFKLLSWHPQVYAYPGKNLGFFSTRFENGWEWYVGNFHPGAQHRVVGEVSHSYLVSKEAPERICELLPHAKMIVCLRDPVERTFSDYLDRKKNGLLTGTFEEELERSPALIDRSCYGTQLRRYLDVFDREQFHIVSFDELVGAPDRFAAGIFQFLGVDLLPIPEGIQRKILPAGTPRSAAIAKGAKALSKLARRAGLTSLRGRVKTSPIIRDILYRPYGKSRPSIQPATRARLGDIFGDEVRQLDRVAGTNFAQLWNYSPAQRECDGALSRVDETTSAKVETATCRAG